jgi:hypothetical protein
MFAPRYFGRRYFAARYFGTGSGVIIGAILRGISVLIRAAGVSATVKSGAVSVEIEN